MSDRIEQLRAEQRGRRGSSSQYDADGLRILWHLGEAALTEALDIAEECLNASPSQQFDHASRRWAEAIAKQERLLDWAKELVQMLEYGPSDEDGVAAPTCWPGKRICVQFLSALDARSGK